MNSPRLWLVRHARPLIAPGLCYGRLDVAADIQATQAASAALAQALPERLAVTRHSPLQRCTQLAQALQAVYPDLDATPDARLTELDFGAWEGRAWNAIARADVDRWTTDFYLHAPGGGESLAQMLHRVAQALQATHALAGAGQGDALWITHAGVARCAQWLLTHGSRAPQAHEWPREAPGFGAWVVLPLHPAAQPCAPTARGTPSESAG